MKSKYVNIDLFIIKKTNDRVLQNDIGKLFLKDNICEYKGPGDYISIDDFYKAIAYACLYKSLGKTVDERPASQITISLIQETHPKLLFKILEKNGAAINLVYPGIYYITGNYPFSMQMIVTKELERSNHSPLRVLTKNVDKEDVRQLLKISDELATQQDKNNLLSIVNASSSANIITYEDNKKEDENMAGIIEIAQREGEARGMVQKALSTAKNLKAMKVLSDEEIAKATELTLEQVKAIAV
ncbi:flagellar biosynthesis protein FlgM [Phascolarctobacterium sp.]|uniref:flagellar biosynthesis protein FlgM n=1 Tax=Phascolarctobacterium sp. TaxID=2049039 RepID=UPI00386FD3C7